MAIKAVLARQMVDRYYLKVTDDTKLLADGITLDPAYMREFNWSLTPPGGMTAAQYRAQIAAEVKALYQVWLTAQAPGAGTALSIEGQAL